MQSVWRNYSGNTRWPAIQVIIVQPCAPWWFILEKTSRGVRLYPNRGLQECKNGFILNHLMPYARKRQMIFCSEYSQVMKHWVYPLYLRPSQWCRSITVHQWGEKSSVNIRKKKYNRTLWDNSLRRKAPSLIRVVCSNLFVRACLIPILFNPFGMSNR